MSRQRPSRTLATLVVASVLAFALAEGCSATPDNTDDDTSSSTGGGSTTTNGPGGSGGSGGNPSACGIDCSTIAAPDCQMAACNAMTGQCEIVSSDEGMPCDDGQFCTTDDTCSSGTCVGGPPNDCGLPAMDCLDITCDETTDSCSSVASPNGAACVPAGDLCISGATCTNGLCLGGAPETCFFFPVPNDCHVAQCNPSSGQCEAVAGNEGAPCSDINDLCTLSKTCAAGVCQGGFPKDCSALTQACDVGICDTTTGNCTTMTAMNGQVCDDLNGCTMGETCTNNVCSGGMTITTCELMGDGCCPTGCTPTTDLDCNNSCLTIKQAAPSSADGVYTIDPDGNGPIGATQVYCDMTQNGGGWTLTARFANADATNWMLDTGEWWYTKTTPAGVNTSTADNADMLSPAFWGVQGAEMKLTRTDAANHAGILVTSGNCLGGQHFRQFITSFGNFQNGMFWPNATGNAVAATCAASFAGNYASTNGFAQVACSGEIGMPNTISFWSDWSAGDGAVMMIGGGGTACLRADHGIGVTEANAASFVYTATGEDDFGANGQDYNDSYALNLWVR